jgi:hypothetical protein
MNHHVIYGISFLVGLALTLLHGHYRRRRQRKSADDQVEYPKLARVEIHPYCCNTCGKPLEHNDLVVWSEKKSGWQGKSSHAECVVFIRHPETGLITNLNGEKLRTNSNGGVIDPLPAGALLLTEDEWSGWVSKEVEIRPLRA